MARGSMGNVKQATAPKHLTLTSGAGSGCCALFLYCCGPHPKKRRKKRQVDTKYVSEMPKEFIFIYLFVECIADAASKFWYLFCDIYTADRKESILGSQMNGRARVWSERMIIGKRYMRILPVWPNTAHKSITFLCQCSFEREFEWLWILFKPG